MKQELDNIKNSIISASKKNNVTKQLWPFQELILKSEIFQDEFIDFIVDILSDSLLFNKPGTEGFILNLASDMDRLTENQKTRIINSITNNYNRYKSDVFCWCVCDYLARNFPESTALQIFGELAKEIKSSSNENGIILGLDIIMKHSTNKAATQKVVKKIFDALHKASHKDSHPQCSAPQ